MKVVILAPISNSLYSCLVAWLASREPGIEVCATVVRSPFSIKRIRSEFRRDGARLVDKVLNKLVLRGQGDRTPSGFLEMAKRIELPYSNLWILSKELHAPCMVAADHNSPHVLHLLSKIQPDVIVFTGGGLIRADLLAIPKLGVLNCHSGILPRYRGMDVVEWPMAENRFDKIGLTLHFMDRGVDTGPILLQKKVTPVHGETILQIRARMEPMMVELMLAGLRGLRDGTLTPRGQKLEDGRQYFVMHPRLKAFAEERLKLFK
jgi:methionyl-tRNA formyltransferase